MLNNKPHNSIGTAKRDNEIECTLNNAIYLQFIFTFDKSIKKFSWNEHMMQHIILEEKFIWITVRIEGGRANVNMSSWMQLQPEVLNTIKKNTNVTH